MPTRTLLFLILMASAGTATAQQPEPAAQDSDPPHFQVQGLATDDELNLRATASATGMLIGRLPMGAVVRNLGCSEVGKYRWCKVGDMNDEKVQGWAAARYLKPAHVDADGQP